MSEFYGDSYGDSNEGAIRHDPPPRPLKYFKRWTHESFSIIKRYGGINVVYYTKPSGCSNKRWEENIVAEFNARGFLFKIIIGEKYPFCEPEFYINGKEYFNWLSIISSVNKKYRLPESIELLCGINNRAGNNKVTSHINVPCFYCESIVNNWQAACKLLDVVDEFFEFREYVLNIYRLCWIKKKLENYNTVYDFGIVLESIRDYLGKYIPKRGASWTCKD